MVTKLARGLKLPDHEEAQRARARVVSIIDSIPPEDLVVAIKRAPSLRGMILGYIAEEMFVRHLVHHPIISDVRQHNDHDREVNKADVDFVLDRRRISIQLKSVQTNTITYRSDLGRLHAGVQNDGSDKRDVLLPDGTTVSTTNYKIDDYHILAVPLFPFTGNWTFAYKLNRHCRRTTSPKYTLAQQAQLLSTIEHITFPLGNEWSTDLVSVARSL